MDEMQQYLIDQSKDYLGHVRKLVSRRSVWALMIEQDEALLEGIKAVDYRREKVSGSPTPPDIAEIMDRLEYNKAQHKANMAELVEVVEDAQKRISNCEPIHARLLLLRYIDDLPWQDISERMVYSLDYCKKELRTAALLEMYDYLPNEWRDPIHSAI